MFRTFKSEKKPFTLYIHTYNVKKYKKLKYELLNNVRWFLVFI